jgi:hypothetical protein
MTFVSEGGPPLHGEIGEVTGCVTSIRIDAETERPIAVELDQTGWVLFAENSPAGEYQWEEGHWYTLEGIVGCDR